MFINTTSNCRNITKFTTSTIILTMIMLGSYPAYSDHNVDHEVESLRGGLGALEQRIWDCENGVDGACLGTTGLQGSQGPEGKQGPQGSQGDQGPTGDSHPLSVLVSYLGQRALINTFPLASLNAMLCNSNSGGSITAVIDGKSFDGVGFIGRGEISTVSVNSVAFRSNTPLTASAFAGKTIKVTVRSNNLQGEFNGEVTRGGLVAAEDSSWIYGIEFKPPMHRLNRYRGYQIRQQQNVNDIFSNLMTEIEVAFKIETTGTPFTHEHVFQHNQSNLDFISRLFEAEGIFYYFNVLGEAIVSDDATSNLSAGSVVYQGHLSTISVGPQLVTMRASTAIPGGKFSFGSYQLLQPGLELFATADAGGIGNEFEFVRELPFDEISKRVNINRDRSTAQADQFLGSGNNLSFRAGYKFDAKDETGARFDGSYLITKVDHVALLDKKNSCVTYMNTFAATASISKYHPPRKTPKPVVGGVSTAVVVETVDDVGRYRVRFPYDTADNSSVWLRTSQPYASNTEAFVLEIGDVVLVGFLEGDPDRPIILGRLSNGPDRPPE